MIPNRAHTTESTRFTYAHAKERAGEVPFRTTLSFRTPGVGVCNGSWAEEKEQGVRKGVRNEKTRKIHAAGNKTCSEDRDEKTLCSEIF